MEDEGGSLQNIHIINKERRKRKKSFSHVCWSDCVWELRTLLGEEIEGREGRATLVEK